MNDEDWMRRCLILARKGEGRTSPNPIVGSVVLDKDGQLVGQGYHAKAGTPHAERHALKEAGARARGGTLYVSMEPCRHRSNRRTTPCAPAVLESGIVRLVTGMPDPIRSHAGGAAWLAKRGVAVTRNVLVDECREANRPFVMWAKHKRPLVVLKAATSLDGKIATASGASKWITGKAARKDGRELRNRLDCILVGINTVLADDPRLTARGRGQRDPVRVILDSRLKTPVSAKVLPANTKSKARVIIATTSNAALPRERRLVACGAEVWRLDPESSDSGRPRPNLGELCRRLAEEEFCSVLVEGGAEIHAAFVRAGLCDELRLYMAPTVIGGDGLDWVGTLGVRDLSNAPGFYWHGETKTLGRDQLVVLRPSGIRK